MANPFLINCPSCKGIPQVIIKESDETQIDIHCSCSLNQTISLHTYLSYLDKNYKLTSKNGSYRDKYTQCPKHPKEEFQCYCLTCKKHFCPLDFQHHNDCQYIDLKNFYSDERVDSILEKFSIAKKEIMTYNEKIKNQITQTLKEKAISIKECYKKKIEKVHEIFAFITIMINNYMSLPTNFYVLSNLMNHSHFKVQRCSYKKNDISSKNIQLIIKYFNNAQILDYIPDSVKSYFFKEKSKIIRASENCIINDAKEKSLEEKYLMKTIIEEKVTSKFEIVEKGKLLAFFDDNKFKLYDLSNFNSIEINVGELTGQVISILSNGNIISTDKNGLYIWHIIDKTIKAKGMIKKVNQEIYDAKLINDTTLALCSYKQKILLISMNPPFHEAYFTINVTDNVLSYLKLRDKEVLACTSVNANVSFYYLPTSKKLTTLKNVECCGPKSMFQFKENNLLVGGPNIITIIDTDTYTIKKKIKNEIFNGIKAITSYNDSSDIILLGCMKGNLIQLEFNNEKIIANIQAHSYQINGLSIIDKKKVISFSGESFIKIWNFNN